jgi:serine/threonine protein kinase
MRLRLTRHEIVGDLTAELDHPHLSSRLAVFSSADDYLVIDRWVEGRELSLHLLQTLPSAVFIKTTMKGVASGLAALHEHGIVLRWLDPRGIVVTDEGEATLVDFEFAKLSGSFRTIRPDHHLPDSGYLAPQVREGLDIGSDCSADVYSWACILARLVSGKRPGLKKNDLPKALIAASRLPARIRGIAEQCLETAPGKRPANGAELLKAIRRW